MSLTSKQLKEYHQQGLIPGPSEDEIEFIRRAEYCLNLRNKLPSELSSYLLEDQSISLACLKNAFLISKSLYDIAPDWIPLFFSNYKLAPWHGGCAWIYQLDENTPTAAFFQLRQNFKKSSRYLFYCRDELIAHELAHVGRMMYEEPKFEEIIAYRSSRQKWRRWLGPIVQSSLESMLFVILLFLIFLLDMYFLFTDNTGILEYLMWLKLLPVGLVSMGFLRLWHRQTLFSRCLTNLSICLNSHLKADHVIYRLQDREIILFSKMKGEYIQQFAEENKDRSLRWQVIFNTYFV